MFENGFPMEIQAAFWSVIAAILLYIARIVGKVFSRFEAKMDNWLDAKLSLDQRAIAQRIGEEAFSFVEATYKEIRGPEKLEKAKEYMYHYLEKNKIFLSPTEVQAMIEKVVTEFNKGRLSGETIYLSEGEQNI